MWIPTRGSNHYDFRAWVDIGAGSLGSEVDTTVSDVRNRRVGG